MKKTIIFFLILSSVNCLAQTNNQDVRIIDGKDYFNKSNEKKQDDPGLKTIDGKKYHIYKVVSGDGWYSIARKFNITIAELRLANKNADDKLFPGKEILIPADKLKSNDPYYEKNYTDAKVNTPKSTVKSEEIKYHTVAVSQTLYSISKMYSTSVELIKEWNNLSTNEIHIGQKLIVAKISDAVKTEPTIQTTEHALESVAVTVTTTKQEEVAAKVDSAFLEPDVEKMTSSSDRSPAMATDINIPANPSPASEGNIDVKNSGAESSGDSTENVVFANDRKQISENGTASILDSEEQGTDKYFALHRTAPIGTIIRVLNMANSRKVYVKVTGVIYDSSENDGILIKLSKASADKIEVEGKSANVNLLYGISEQ